jgi:hypothetical protein
LALVAGLVSVNLAPEIAEPLGSFTDPAMLPVGEAETVAVMNRRMSAQAANRGPRDRHIKKAESVLRRMSIPSQSELFFKPQAGVGQLKLARAYSPVEALVKRECFVELEGYIVTPGGVAVCELKEAEGDGRPRHTVNLSPRTGVPQPQLSGRLARSLVQLRFELKQIQPFGTV